MPKEQVTRLFRDSLANPSLKEELNTAPDVEAFILMAQKRGYDFTLDEWKEMTRFTVEEFKGKLSEIPGI